MYSRNLVERDAPLALHTSPNRFHRASGTRIACPDIGSSLSAAMPGAYTSSIQLVQLLISKSVVTRSPRLSTLYIHRCYGSARLTYIRRSYALRCPNRTQSASQEEQEGRVDHPAGDPVRRLSLPLAPGGALGRVFRQSWR